MAEATLIWPHATDLEKDFNVYEVYEEHLGFVTGGKSRKRLDNSFCLIEQVNFHDSIHLVVNEMKGSKCAIQAKP